MPQYKICDHCKQGFYSNHARKRFCSNDCAYPIRECELCGKSFKSKLHFQTYCSNECSGIAKRNRVKQLCNYCGVEFEQVKSHADLGLTAYCSHECYAHSLENKLNVTCENCGKEFERAPNRIGNQVFCSSGCRYEKWHGENNPSWKVGKADRGRGSSWEIQRKKAIKRDGGKCQICGYRHRIGLKRQKIDVHHITPYRLFDGDHEKANELSNLITLCRTCHSKVEHHGLPCPRKLL